MKHIFMLLLSLALLISAAGCSDDKSSSPELEHDPELIGTWDLQSEVCNGVNQNSELRYLTLNADGSAVGTDIGQSIVATWSTRNNTITFKVAEKSETDTYIVSGNTFTVTGVYGDQTCTFIWIRRT